MLIFAGALVLFQVANASAIPLVTERLGQHGRGESELIVAGLVIVPQVITAARMYDAGGFYRGNGAHERIWKTPEGKAVFTTPGQLNSLGFQDAPGRYRLITLRSNDQFNTTIYGYSDRLRGLEGSRDILLMCPEDIAQAGLTNNQTVTLVTDVDDGRDRRLGGLTLTAYKLPRGTIAGYYPECNVLVPIGHCDQLSKTPASKSVPVRVEAA